MIITSDKLINKFDKQFEKISKRMLNKISDSSYYDTLKAYGIYTQANNGKSLLAVPTEYIKVAARTVVQYTLQDIDYVKTDKHWHDVDKIGFICDAMNLYQTQGSEEFISQKTKEISRRYNISASRIKSQLALFINNALRYNTDIVWNYFCLAEILQWKYRDVEKLQSDIENDKITKEHLEVMKNLGMIQG